MIPHHPSILVSISYEDVFQYNHQNQEMNAGSDIIFI